MPGVGISKQFLHYVQFGDQGLQVYGSRKVRDKGAVFLNYTQATPLRKPLNEHIPV
jgi:hypothetical protein